MHPLPIPAFLERVSREENVDLTPLAPFVQQLAKDSHELSYAYPRELVEVGLSRESAELLISRARGWKERSKYDIFHFFFGLDGLFVGHQPLPAATNAKPQRLRE